MKTENDVYPVIIRCPFCETAQGAIMEITIPFGTYIHHCVTCEYIITESEWEEVKPFKLNYHEQRNS